MPPRPTAVLRAATPAWILLATVAGCTQHPTSGTAPLTLEMQSPIVTLALRSKSGAARPVRFFVDTGGGAFMLTGAMAAELGLAVKEEAAIAEGSVRLAPMQAPQVAIDGFDLDMKGARCLAVLDGRPVVPGSTAEGFLPGHVLARHHVVFDYPGAQFTLARPGSMTPRGSAVPSPVSKRMRYPRVELEVNGAQHGFLLDTGASFTMISSTEMLRWRAADSTLAVMTGAVGEANMMGGAMESKAQLMRLPPITWGGFTLRGVAAVSRPPGVFEEAMTAMMNAPIVGAVGGNVLRHLRVEIDYAKGTTYLEAATQDFATQLDAVGMVLAETPEGDHRVDAIASAGGKALCDGVQAGDVLYEVDGRPVAGLRHRQVIDLLRGEPGTARALVLGRAGLRVECTVPVVRPLSR